MGRSSTILTLRAILIISLSIFSIFSNGIAQTPVQTIKGEIRNASNQQLIDGVVIQLIDKTIKKTAISNNKGVFKLEKITVGRYLLKISCVGFKSQVHNIVLTSGKELLLNIQLEESYTKTEEIVISEKNNNIKSINESTLISSTQFSVDDAERYAGSRGDPARMAQNFPGVIGANSLRNDIIIRGGSPIELLWRLDGLDIPNPNHFGTQGATGGPVGAINSRLLNNSDFVSGAFSAEYGDKMSGVFDLRTRNGNDEKFEYMAQLGYNGVEAGIEGPISAISGSFIANYRYSFLDLFKLLGMDLGIVGIPRYQDGMFKLHSAPNGKNQFDITTLIGRNNIFMERAILDDVVTGDWDLKSENEFYAISFKWQHIFSEKLFANLMFGFVSENYTTNIDSLTCDSINIHNVISKDKWFTQNSFESYVNAKYSLSYSPVNNHIFTLGLEARSKFYGLNEKRYTTGWGDYSNWDLNYDGNAFQTLNYINWNWKISNSLTSNIGIHSQYLTISDKLTFEPRLALAWQFLSNQSINLGIGVHNQSLPLLLYFSDTKNNSLDFMQSIHYILGYSLRINDNMYIKAESYYKDISKVPVSSQALDSWSFLNSGTNFGSVGGKVDLISKGTGACYGAELSLFKHFSDGYYITTTLSYIRQQFRGSDDIQHFGGFDNRYIVNILAGYEWKLTDIFTIEFSGKFNSKKIC